MKSSRARLTVVSLSFSLFAAGCSSGSSGAQSGGAVGSTDAGGGEASISLDGGEPDGDGPAPADATTDAGVDATTDAGGDATTEASGDAATEASGDATADAGGDGTTDAGDDATADAGGDAAAGDASDGGTEGGALTTLSSLAVSTGTLSPAFSPGVTAYDISSLTSLHPISVTATTTDPSATLTIEGAAAVSGVAASVTLQPGEDLSVAVRAADGSASQTYVVHYVPAFLPPYTVEGTPAGSEDILLTPDARCLLMVDRSGAPLYYRTFSPNHATDFERHVLTDGSVRYSTNVGVVDSAGWQLGVEHVMDGQLGDVEDVQLLPNGAHGALPAEAHDFVLFDDDHYIAETYLQRAVDLSVLDPSWSTNAIVVNPIVQEVDHGAVVLEWDAADFASLYTDSVDGNAFAGTGISDYAHLNSIAIDPTNGNVVLSLRHTNSILEVDRTTGQIVWTLGGAEDDFGLTPDEVFSHQHYARFDADGSLVVFDNGNNLHQTRIISFVLDEVNRKVTGFEVLYEKPATEPQTTFMGSWAHLDTSRYLYGWGGWATTDIEPAVTEVVGGQVTWSLTIASPRVYSYRALPIPAL